MIIWIEKSLHYSKYNFDTFIIWDVIMSLKLLIEPRFDDDAHSKLGSKKKIDAGRGGGSM